MGLNDPYALAAYGGTKTVDELDKIAKQAVKDKLDALIKEKKEKADTGQPFSCPACSITVCRSRS